MAQLNALGEGGLNNILVRRLNISGGPPSPTVEPALFPVLALESDRFEWRYLSGTTSWHRRAQVAAGGAGTRSSCSLLNADGSGVIVTVEYLRAQSNFNGYTQFLGPVGIIGTSVTGFARDLRTRGGSTARVVSDNTLAAGSNIAFAGTAGTSFNNEWVLPPGSRIVVQHDTDNTILSDVVFAWRERRAEPGELV